MTLTTNERRVLNRCDQDEPAYISEFDPDAATVATLVSRGLLELLPGCSRTFGTTDMGRDARREWLESRT